MRKTTFLNSNAPTLFFVIMVLTIADTAHAQMTNFGNLYINTSGNVNVNGSFVNTGSSSDLSNSGNLQLTGDFTNNGNDLNASGTGTVLFSGTAAQNINGTQPSTFYNLTQANAGDVIIANNETVNNTLTLTTGSLSLNNNILTLNGAVTYSSGGLSSTPASGLILNGAAVKNLYFKPGYHTIKDVTINTSAANINLNDSLHITAGNASGSLIVDGKLNTNGYLTLKSDAGGTARVAPSSGTINGKITVERYFHAKRAWRLMTAPLKSISSPNIFDAWQLSGLTTATSPAAPAAKGELITGAAGGIGLDQGINNNPSLKIFTSSTGALSGVSNTQVSVSPGTYATGTGSNKTGENIGYFNFVRGDRNPSNIGAYSIPNITTLSSTGMLQTGDQTFTFPLAAGNAEKFILVGNPYACPIDFASIIADNAATISNKFWAWDPEAGGPNNVGAYVIYDGINGYTTPASPGGQNGDIQSGQAVYFSTTKADSAKVVFHESHKSDSTVRGPLFRPMIFTTSQVTTNLKFLNEDNSTSLVDGVLSQFNSSFSDSVDIQDGLKFPNVNESFSLMRNGKLLTIERRNKLSQSDTLFFNLSRSTQRSYQLEFIAEGLGTSGLTGYLEDSYLKTNTAVNLSGTTTVNFSINADAASQASNRFCLVFVISAPLPVTFTNVKAYEQNAGINVEWKVENETLIKYYEVEKSFDGRTFIKSGEVAAKGNNVASQTYNFFDAQPTKGDNYYRIKSIGINGEYKYTSIIRVTIIQESMTISVYPNPVKNNIVNLKFTNTIAGMYNISLYSNDGKKIFAKNIHLATETSSLGMLVNVLMHGIYELKISGSKITRTLKVIVE